MNFISKKFLFTFWGALGGKTFETLAWQGVKLTLIDVNFYLQKVWKFLIKTQLSKSDPKKTSAPIICHFDSSSRLVST